MFSYIFSGNRAQRSDSDDAMPQMECQTKTVLSYIEACQFGQQVTCCLLTLLSDYTLRLCHQRLQAVKEVLIPVRFSFLSTCSVCSSNS